MSAASRLTRRGCVATLGLICALVLASPAMAQDVPGPAPLTNTTPGAGVPTRIRIPRIGADAPIVPLGLDDDGAMAAPVDPDTVGWFDLGAGLGGPGNTLLDGHVDWGGRLRAFGLLKTLREGDLVQITADSGAVYRYSVSWTRLVDAEDAPVDELLGPTPDEVVTLITCGGEFDHATHQYLSRIVVRARRVTSDE